MEVLVEHDYVAKESNELTISKGDVISEVVDKPGGWWEGRLKDKRGLFPDNFVQVLMDNKDSTVVMRSRKDAARIRQCRVVFSYKQDHEDELNLKVGDIIEILGEEEEGWWRGILNGKAGVFPSNFVEEIVVGEGPADSVAPVELAPPLFAKPAKILCEVKFAYKAQNDDELTLKEGDIVTLLSKDGQDPGWWKGELNGLVGVFPDNFVGIITEEEARNRPKTSGEPVSPKTPSGITTSNRRSLEVDQEGSSKTTPPLPGKKPSVPLKKSPSGSNSGLFQGLRKKLVDVVDGATGSKTTSPKADLGEAEFDEVHRRPLLGDVRASRPKAPGRRPPSMIGKDPEPGLVNGNTEPPVEPLIETPEPELVDVKPKLREWEKRPAPWLEEMKLNQAKRSSSNVSTQDKLKLTPTDKNEDDNKTKNQKLEASPIDTKPKTNLKKTPPGEFPMIRNKPNVPIPTRPQTIQNVYGEIQKVTKQSPKTPSPMHNASGGGGDGEIRTNLELEERIGRLEELVERQRRDFESAIEELKGKLQLETEMRMKLQVKFEKFSLDGAIQQL